MNTKLLRAKLTNWDNILSNLNFLTEHVQIWVNLYFQIVAQQQTNNGTFAYEKIEFLQWKCTTHRHKSAAIAQKQSHDAAKSRNHVRSSAGETGIEELQKSCNFRWLFWNKIQEAWVVERMGRFSRILNPGLNFLIPVIDQVKYVQSLKEIAIGERRFRWKFPTKFQSKILSDVPKQSAITSDNVTLSIDGVLYLRILNAYDASYGVEDPEFAITQLAQTTMRSELGKMSLDKIFREREALNISIVESINKAGEAWGIVCLRYEIRDIKLPSRIHEAMQMQVEAERRKRAVVLESEGEKESQKLRNNLNSGLFQVSARPTSMSPKVNDSRESSRQKLRSRRRSTRPTVRRRRSSRWPKQER